MRLRAEGIVPAPLEQTWQALLDVERLAGAMPGVTLRPATSDGIRRGTLAVDGTAYVGSARLVEIDEDEKVAAFAVYGREVRGGGAVSATIRNRFTPVDGGTRVSVEADLHVTGPGRVPDGAGAVAMGRFVTGLQNQVLATGGSSIGTALAWTRTRRTRVVVVGAAVGAAVAVLAGWRLLLRRRGGASR